MPHQLVVPYRKRGRILPTLCYSFAIAASSLRLHRDSHASGPWIFALASILIGVLVSRMLFMKTFIFTDRPRAIRCEWSFAGIRVKRGTIEPPNFRWVRSRMGSFEPRDAIIELGTAHSYDAVTVQTIKYAMNETPEVIKTRADIAHVLGIDDRGHERLPPQRSFSQRA